MNSKLQDLRKALLALSPSERAQLLEALATESVDPKESLQARFDEEHFAKGRFCPYCRSTSVVRNGKQSDGTQRYKCQSCGKRFQSNSHTLFAGTLTQEKEKQVHRFLQCMLDNLSLRRCAEECRISLPTAFSWRHRILDGVRTFLQDYVADGIVETDETFYNLSFKGRRPDPENPWPGRKRGGALTAPTYSLVCIPCAIDRSGVAISRISNLGNPKADDISRVVSNETIKNGSVLCTDGAHAYHRVARAADCKLVQIKGSKGTRGIYGIQHINSYHSHLRNLINHRFRGVATKYLNNYLAWFNLTKLTQGDRAEFLKLLQDIAVRAISPTTRNLSNRDPVPILSLSQRRILDCILLDLAEAEIKERQLSAQSSATKQTGIEPETEDLPF